MAGEWESGGHWLARAVVRYLLALLGTLVVGVTVLEFVDGAPPADVVPESIFYSVVLLGCLALVVMALPSALLLGLVALGYRSPWLRLLALLALAGPALVLPPLVSPQCDWIAFLPAAFQAGYALLVLPRPRLVAGTRECVERVPEAVRTHQ